MMSTSSHGQAMSQSPAATLANLGLSPSFIMSSISEVNRLSLDYNPHLDLQSPPPYTASQSLQKFTIFSELPTEMRLKIWHHACFVGRDIYLKMKILGSLQSTPTSLNYHAFQIYEFRAKNACPAILLACKESRDVALEHYQLSFGTSAKFLNTHISTSPTIYVNWESDRICLALQASLQGSTDHNSPIEMLFRIFQQNKLRYLAFNACQNKHWCYVGLTTKIPSLREVMLYGGGDTINDAEIDLQTGLIGLDQLAAEYPAVWHDARNQAWVRRLMSHRTDLATFFGFKHVSTLKVDSKPGDSWQAPNIELGWTMIRGHPGLSEWDW